MLPWTYSVGSSHGVYLKVTFAAAIMEINSFWPSVYKEITESKSVFVQTQMAHSIPDCNGQSIIHFLNLNKKLSKWKVINIFLISPCSSLSTT